MSENIYINDGEYAYCVDKKEAYAYLSRHKIEIESYQGTERISMNADIDDDDINANDQSSYSLFCNSVSVIIEKATDDDESEAAESWRHNPARVGDEYFEVIR